MIVIPVYSFQYESNPWIHIMPKKMTQCPIARSLERVGDAWSVLILRDALYGLTRFDEFEKSLGIAPNILTRRLTSLVEAGMLERHQYSDHAGRFDYRLTEAGRDFRTVMLAFLAWGNRHFATDGLALVVADAETGEIAEPQLVDKKSRRALSSPAFRVMAGPAANEKLRERYRSLPGNSALLEVGNE
jgi:DNA-binding HxlR family transcriptional regulator